MSRDICVHPCVPSTVPSVTVPMMGASIMGQSTLSASSDCAGCEAMTGMLTQLGPMFGALGVPICLLSCVGAVINAVKAVPDSLGPPPDPTALISAVANMVDKCSCVAEIALPPPAGAVCGFLKMTSDLVTVSTQTMTCAVSIVTSIVAYKVKAQSLTADPATEVAGQCALAQSQKLMDSFNVKMAPLSAVFTVVQPVFDLLSAVVPPPFSTVIGDVLSGFSAFTGGTPSGTDPETYLSALQDLTTVLNTAATAFTTIVSVCP